VKTVLVPYDQLHRHHGALANATPATHDILMVESTGMLQSRTWHAQRLQLILSAAAHFAAELTVEGFNVHHRVATSVQSGVEAFRVAHPTAHVIATEPRSRALLTALRDVGVEMTPDDSFLTSRGDFQQWASGKKSLTMEPFYRWQRQRLGYLMDGKEPEGGAWNFDADNRLPPPKKPHTWPEPPTYQPDDIDRRVHARIVDGEFPITGNTDLGMWGTTREHALHQLHWFLEHAFADFGPYEDAMPNGSWTVNHSLLSPYLNIGLLHPKEVCDAAIDRYAAGGIPISSAEGFIRQIIGWREYINGVYWAFPPDYSQLNQLQAERPLLPLFTDPNATDMACMQHTITDLMNHGWNHHIPRLMLMANLALVSGVNPQEFLAWMRRMFIDAADWVMVPNVIGMGVYADGGVMMTKPYAAGGAYIKRMGQFCSSCRYNPAIRTGEDACPFTTLYWDFLDRHRDLFGRNHRMNQQVGGLRKRDDIDEIRVTAQRTLRRLSTRPPGVA
jgi:deoxyribodipyrimidine photolyase-related protein